MWACPYNRRRSKKGRPSAFTIVEMLVVIGVIGFLAAITIPVLSSVRSKAHKAATVNLLKHLESAIKEYELDWGMVFSSNPSDHPGVSTTGEVLWAMLAGRALKSEGYTRTKGPYMAFKEDENIVNKGGAAPAVPSNLAADYTNARWAVVDLWGGEINYRDSDDTPQLVNLQGFDLWSNGRDGQSNSTNGALNRDSNTLPADDIGNFTQP